MEENVKHVENGALKIIGLFILIISPIVLGVITQLIEHKLI
jgi:hypothetical protein